MDKLLNLALVLLADVVPSERKSVNTRRVTMAAACAVLAAIALVGAIGCGVAAMWIYLASIYGALGAALGCAVGLLIIGGGLIVVARGQFREEQRTGAKASLGEDLVNELRFLFLRHKGSALLSALIAGLAAGRGK